MTRVDPRGVICPSKITRVDMKTLPYMPHGREMTMSSSLIYIYICNHHADRCIPHYFNKGEPAMHCMYLYKIFFPFYI
jgi:hypothetical protein